MITLYMRIIILFILALILTIMPLPGFLMYARPPWVLYVLIYLQFNFPNLYNLTLNIILGILLDVLLSTPLGEHGLALTLTSWIAYSQSRQFNFYSVSSQMIILLFLCFFYQFTIYLVDLQQGYGATLFVVFGTVFVSFLIWPWVGVLLNRYLRGANYIVKKIL